MTIAYFDCFAGAAGDMIVGALLDAGASFAALQAELAKLGLPGYQLQTAAVQRGGLGGTHFQVELAEHDHHHRRLAEILEMIDRAGLSPAVAANAKTIFQRLGEAEAKVHRVSVQDVHFHEVGAVDSIVDIVGACVAFDLLNVDEVYCSPIPCGSGTIDCAHGKLPVPAPAVAAMLVGGKLAADPLTGEVTTPTGAAILTTLAKSYGPLPAMDIQAVGYGAGSRDAGDVPNLLRVFIGAKSDSGDADTVVELSANLDDCTGEIVGATLAALMDMGCLDAWATPIYMKKNRPAFLLSALCSPADAAAVEEAIFLQTTTFGVRRRACTRSKLHREHHTVETPYGPVRVKLGLRRGQVVTAAPEFSDCQSAAASHHLSVREVMAAALRAYSVQHPTEGGLK
jgi:uncharacterized protein (TIGR00299 family) protein